MAFVFTIRFERMNQMILWLRPMRSEAALGGKGGGKENGERKMKSWRFWGRHTRMSLRWLWVV